MKKLEDLTPEDILNMSDEEMDNTHIDINHVPLSKSITRLTNEVRAYIKDGELGVDFTHLDQPRKADKVVTTKVSDEKIQKLRGDNWREIVRDILEDNK